MLDNLPDNITLEYAIRKMSLKQVEMIKYAEKEKAKLSYEIMTSINPKKTKIQIQCMQKED